MTCDKMVQTRAKHDKIFTVSILRAMFATRTNDISAIRIQHNDLLQSIRFPAHSNHLRDR